MNLERLRKIGRTMWQIVKGVLSPTCALAYCCKRSVQKQKKNKDARRKAVGALIRKFHRGYLIVASLLALVCSMLSVGGYGTEYRNPYFAFFAALVWIYSISRANEIFYAFLGDAIAKVKIKNDRSDLGCGDRIRLALWSYLELVVNFASVYYVMPADWFNKSLETYWQALYFSGVTITTLGFGDFAPKCWVPQLLSVYEVFCGFSLLIVSFTVYVSRGTSPNRGR